MTQEPQQATTNQYDNDDKTRMTATTNQHNDDHHVFLQYICSQLQNNTF